MKQEKFTPHKTAVFALFILGEAGILIPYKNGNDKSFLGFLIAFVSGGAIMLLSAFLISRIEAIKTEKIKKYLCGFVFFAVAAYCIFLSVDSFNVFIDFVSQYVLPDSSKYLVGLIFTALIIFLSISQITVLYKLGFITAILSVIILIVLFCFSVPQFSADNIILLSFPSLKDVLTQSFYYLKSAFLPIIVLPFFVLVYSKQEQKSSLLKGYFSGSFLLTICILNSLLIFGSSLSSKLDFPYSEAIATVTAGNIFTRMDGFSYFVFFVSCLIKICLCIKLSATLLKDIYFIFKNKEQIN